MSRDACNSNHYEFKVLCTRYTFSRCCSVAGYTGACLVKVESISFVDVFVVTNMCLCVLCIILAGQGSMWLTSSVPALFYPCYIPLINFF